MVDFHNIFFLFPCVLDIVGLYGKANFMQTKPLFSSTPYWMLALISFINIYTAHSQALTYRPGEIIVLLKAFEDPIAVKKISKSAGSRGSSPNIEPIRRLGPTWNIWLMKYDPTKWTFAEVSRQLNQDPNILGFQRNKLLQLRKQPNDPFFMLQWFHNNDGSTGGTVNADFDSDKAWDLTTGGITESGDTIVICIIDEGLEIGHEDIAPNMWVNRAEIPSNGKDDDQNGYVDDYRGWNSFQSNDLFDPGKHGTAVTGLAAAKGNNGLGISGMSWNTRIMFVQGGGDEANALESYAYPLLMRRLYNQSNGQHGAFVVATNTSWGADLGKPEDSPLWCAIYDSLGKEGILNVASTTNQNVDVDSEGDLPTTCPSEYLLTTTNMTDLDIKKTAAGYGKISIDLGAYGESTYSTYINNSYRYFGGTSAAAPQVTGAIGLLYALPCLGLDELAKKNPSAAAVEAKQLIMQSVKANASLKDITVTGGVLNSFNALMMALPFQISSPNSRSLVFSGKQSELRFPIMLRYRKSGNVQWKDTMFLQGELFELPGLEICTAYEVQWKNVCIRWNDDYSPIRLLKTGGCCDPIDNILITSNDGSNIRFQYHDPAQGTQLTALLRKEGSVVWDTFRILQNASSFGLAYLEPCTQYEMLLFSYCGGKPSFPSSTFLFTSSGCESCTELNYCRRFRPSSELEWLHSISLNNIQFISGNNQGYGNFIGTNHQWYLELNRTYPLELRAGYLSDTSRMVASAWIDLNQDGSFDDGENFALSGLPFKGSIQFNVQIPPTSKTGYTRMRLALKFAEFSSTPPLACFQSLEFGEYEDYCIYIGSESCAPIQDIDYTEIRTDGVQILLGANPSSRYEYAYRKLYSSDWTIGRTNFRLLKVNDLDSCSRYEIRVRAVCGNLTSPYLQSFFTTLGQGCIVGTEHPMFSSIQLYPNPADDVLNVQSNTPLNLKAFKLISLQGSIRPLLPIHQSGETLVRFDLNGISPGLYWLQYRKRDGTLFTKPFIKM